MPGTTLGRFRLTSATKISSTPSGTPNYRRRGLSIFGVKDKRRTAYYFSIWDTGYLMQEELSRAD
jgi:hypothetical protein